ncbi:MAG TPA: N-acetyltransferase [Mesorhizobium sp.]|jgi:predicted N-acetyltransferase YhbS|nr:N-acetyltransferase [Mesorhizobium sp.]
MPDDIHFLPERAAHDALVEALHEAAFGPGRFARAAHLIREQGPPRRDLSLAAWRGEELVGSVRLTPVAAGGGRGLLLGPLAVVASLSGKGIGKALVRRAVEGAAAAGEGLVLLVGDEPYYGPLGFRRVPRGQVAMPLPVDPDRLLAHEIVPGALERFRGMVTHAARAVAPSAASA